MNEQHDNILTAAAGWLAIMALIITIPILTWDYHTQEETSPMPMNPPETADEMALAQEELDDAYQSESTILQRRLRHALALSRQHQLLREHAAPEDLHLLRYLTTAINLITDALKEAINR